MATHQMFACSDEKSTWPCGPATSDASWFGAANNAIRAKGRGREQGIKQDILEDRQAKTVEEMGAVTLGKVGGWEEADDASIHDSSQK